MTAFGVAKELLRSRGLVALLTRRELGARYRGSALGFLWTLLNPAALVATYSLVFAVFARLEQADYPLFLCTGLLPWLWFASALSAGTTTLLRNRPLVTHGPFPPQILPAVEVLAALVHFLLALLVLIAAAALYGRPPGPALLALPVLIACQAGLTLGLVLAASAATVYYRDVQFLLSHALSLWLYLTPGILYSQELAGRGLSARLAPPWDATALAALCWLNPLAPLLEGYQSILFQRRWPEPGVLGASAAHGTLLLLVGLVAFGRYRYPLVEEL